MKRSTNKHQHLSQPLSLDLGSHLPPAQTVQIMELREEARGQRRSGLERHRLRTPWSSARQGLCCSSVKLELVQPAWTGFAGNEDACRSLDSRWGQGMECTQRRDGQSWRCRQDTATHSQCQQAEGLHVGLAAGAAREDQTLVYVTALTFKGRMEGSIGEAISEVEKSNSKRSF